MQGSNPGSKLLCSTHTASVLLSCHKTSDPLNLPSDFHSFIFFVCLAIHVQMVKRSLPLAHQCDLGSNLGFRTVQKPLDAYTQAIFVRGQWLKLYNGLLFLPVGFLPCAQSFLVKLFLVNRCIVT